MQISKSSNCVLSVRTVFFALVVCTVWSCHLISNAQAPAVQESPKPTALAAGRHALKGGESHSYSINLTQGQYLYALVEQQGIDVGITLFRPDGSQVAVTNSPNDRWGTEPILLVADVSGEHRVEVRASNAKANAAAYDI